MLRAPATPGRIILLPHGDHVASLGAVREGSEGSTRRTRAGHRGSHQFQRPKSDTAASSARMRPLNEKERETLRVLLRKVAGLPQEAQGAGESPGGRPQPVTNA